MNYTETEIELIKQKAYDRGRMEGVVVTLLVCTLFLVLAL
jgi:hypothetical protein